MALTAISLVLIERTVSLLPIGKGVAPVIMTATFLTHCGRFVSHPALGRRAGMAFLAEILSPSEMVALHIFICRTADLWVNSPSQLHSSELSLSNPTYCKTASTAYCCSCSHTQSQRSLSMLRNREASKTSASHLYTSYHHHYHYFKDKLPWRCCKLLSTIFCVIQCTQLCSVFQNFNKPVR